MADIPSTLRPYDPFGAVGGNATNQIYPLVSVFGADPTGVTDSTAAFQAYEATFVQNALTGGGVIDIPPGRFIVNGWEPTRYNVLLRGSGIFATTLVSSTAGEYTLRLGNTQGPRWHVSDLAIDANGLRETPLSFGETANCVGNVFTKVYLRGGLVDTFRLGGVGQAWDISLNTFINCSFDSAAPSNSNMRVRGTNTSQTNRFITCNFGPNGTVPHNIDLADGAVQLDNCYYFGAASYDIEAASGRVIVRDGTSESAGGFIHTAATDVSLGYNHLPHIVDGIILGNVGSPTANTIYHEALRMLKLRDVTSRRTIRIGTQGRVARDNVSFFDPAATFVYEGSAQSGSVPFCKLFKSAAQSIPVTGEEVTFNFESIDSFGMHDTATNNARVAAPVGYAGWYRLVGQLSFDAVALGVLLTAKVMKNSAIDTGGRVAVCGTAGGNIFPLHDRVFLNEGEWLSVWAQPSVGPVDLLGGGLAFTSLTVSYEGND